MSIEEAWKTLTGGKAARTSVEGKETTSTLNWIIVRADTKQMELLETGTGGLEDMKAKFDATMIQIAAIRVTGVDERSNVISRRPKFVVAVYVGNKVSAIRKNAILQHKAQMDRLFNGAACTMQFSDCDAPPAELTHKSIAKTLLAAGGAHKPVYYEFNPNGEENIKIADLYESK